MTDDVRARFLAGIAAQLPAERVQELHLFSGIRQGGAESGVAVIAVERSDTSAHDDGTVVEHPAAAPTRSIVYTARYRLTLKGLDRGKWEMSVTEEADAPLLTVDAVVRGVSRRSGDPDETVRLTGEEFRAMLPAAPEPARA